MNKFFTAQEVADKLKIKKTTVYDLIKRGELASSKVGKQIRVSEEQLEQYISGNSAVPQPYQSGFQPESSLLKRDYLLHSSGIILSGQSSPALELLLSRIAAHPQGLPVLQSHMNDYNSLYALYFEKAHIAAVSLFPEAIKSLAPGMPLTLFSLYNYTVGFYVKKENPCQIHSFEDLAKPDIHMINREKGSSRRIWLDDALRKCGISSSEISGYRKETVSDMAAASAVADGNADVAFGEKMTARYFPNLDFIPVSTETMYLVLSTDSLEKPGFLPLKEIIMEGSFQKELHMLTGYDTSVTGQMLNI